MSVFIIMDNNVIVSIAQNKILSDLCVRWYLETHDEQKQLIFEEIQNTHKSFYTDEK
jgi:hypothetical protein